MKTMWRRFLQRVFPPRYWHVKSYDAFPRNFWWLEGSNRLGTRYNLGPFFNLDEALEHCAKANGRQ